jgi:alpha-tubulin suppressor-like RCC1 family protein
MGLKPVIAFALLLLLSGCGTLRISVDYGSTPTPSNPASTSDFAGTLGALSTWTPTPTISPTATTAQTGTPTQAVTAPVDEGIVAVSSIQDHTCALTGAGRVKCWGNNQYGQLGYGQPADYRLTAVDVFELTFGAAAASAGGGQTCALTPGGGILCWGNNKYGQLGDGTGEKRNVPTAVAGITQGAAKVVTGWNHTCAVMGNGELQCWGWNYYGQLGNGNRTSQSKPVNSKRLMENVRDVAAGWSHTCAVTVDGGVLCWGSNQYGQLGDGTNIDSSEPLVVVGLGGSGASSTAPQTATATQTGKTPSPMYGPTPTATPAEPTRTSSKPT